MNAQQKADRAWHLARDVEHVVKVVRVKALAAKRRNGTICSDNVRSAVESGPVRLLPAYSDRKYLSALYGQAMLRASREGAIKLAGWTRTKRVGKRGGAAVRLWRAA